MPGGGVSGYERKTEFQGQYTYFATRNVTEFTKQAEALKGMVDAANRCWGRVQVMGYELAPDNELFSGAREIA